MITYPSEIFRTNRFPSALATNVSWILSGVRLRPAPVTIYSEPRATGKPAEDIFIGGLQGICNLFQAYSVGTELQWCRDHLILFGVSADRRDLGHTWHGEKAVFRTHKNICGQRLMTAESSRPCLFEELGKKSAHRDHEPLDRIDSVAIYFCS